MSLQKQNQKESQQDNNEEFGDNNIKDECLNHLNVDTDMKQQQIKAESQQEEQQQTRINEKKEQTKCKHHHQEDKTGEEFDSTLQNSTEMDAYHPDNNEFLQDEEEMSHFLSIICSYFNYRSDTLKEVERMERGYIAIKDNIQYLKTDYSIKIDSFKLAIERNAQFLDKVVANYRKIAYKKDINSNIEFIPPGRINHRDVSKLRSTLRQLIRDWSEEGKIERDTCYKPVWEEFIKHFPSNKDKNGDRVRVLFPGCGLARIAFDFACAGYGAQGNEFSYHMLLASNFILNNITKKKQFTIQPFIHSFCNQFKENDPFRMYSIPDINPSEEMNPELNDDFSMAAGEFIQIYSQQKEEWNCVCTVFFIDTANDIIEYVKTIHSTLKAGGVWINLGPLLYHYAESPNENSIELSWEELKYVIEKVGFQLTVHPSIKSQYASDPFETMMKVQYNCIFFTAIKI